MWKKTFITVLIATSAIGQEDTPESPPSGSEASAGGTQVSSDDYPAAATDAKSGKDIDYDGVSGPVDLAAIGEPTVAPYNIWSVVSGKITSVERGVLP